MRKAGSEKPHPYPHSRAQRCFQCPSGHAILSWDEEGKLLRSLLPWGRMLVHIFDQGKALAEQLTEFWVAEG